MRKVFHNLICFAIICGVILSAGLLLTACKGQEEAGQGITFTDALGREVTVPEKPERVAALLGSFADVWTLAGGELCAAADDAWEDFGLELEGAVNIGGAGTLISSLASLITFREFIRHEPGMAKRYIKLFTVYNFGISLVLLLLMHFVYHL